MDKLELKKNDLSFAFLVQSHSLACQCLFDVVVDSVKAANPDDWKNTLCAVLRERPSHQLCLDTNSQQTDIFFVCKLLRYRINDVAKYIGGGLTDLRQKERFCLQVHGVETARHWVFHGDQKVSPREVRSSVILLSTILSTLSFNSQRLARVADRLSLLLDQVERLANPKAADQSFALALDTIVSAMVYRGLSELKWSFEKMFAELHTSKKEDEPERKTSTRVRPGDDFSSLFKQIKVAIMKEPKREGFCKENYVGMCENVRKARNHLAHNPPFTVHAAWRILEDMHNLLEYFHLSKTMTKTAIEIIAHLEGKEKYSHVCILSKERNDLEDRERILRPASIPLIGRQEEIFAIQTVFAGKRHLIGQKVLICGPSGIGKSYLASHIAKSLSLRFTRQVWLSCGTVQDLEQDISTAFPNCKVPSGLTDCDQILRVLYGGQNAERQRLFVFDDVCSVTMAILPKIIANQSPALITTRSTVVQHFLQENLSPLEVIELKPFSSAESWDLIKEKVHVSDMSEQTVATIENILDKMLENLPLCVSIYTSWLAFSEKKKRQKSSPRCQKHSIFGEHGNKITAKNWAELEEGFGNPFHVRGLTGVVQAAERYLEDHPLAVFLLAKICLVDNQNIPWEVIRKSYRWTAYDIEPNAQRLVGGLLGVLDWLFSDSGQETLVFCREALEELGLIQWKVSTANLHVHGLIIQSIRQLLASRNYFLSPLLGCSTHKSRKSCEAITISPIAVYQNISEELLLQFFSTGILLLKKLAANQIKEEEADEVKTCIFPFLSRLVGKTIPDRTDRLKRAQYFLVETLLKSKYDHDLFSTAADENRWAEVYQERPENKEVMQSLRLLQCVNQAETFAYNGCFEQACRLLEQRLLPVVEGVSGCNSLEAVLVHSKIAWWKKVCKGPKAKKDYLTKVAHKCPSLQYAENLDSVRQGILFFLSKECCSKHFTRLFNFWQQQIQSQIEDNMKDGYCNNQYITETALLLIMLRQQRQRLFMERLTSLQESAENDSLGTEYCLSFLREIDHETNLWYCLNYLGRALRCISNTKSVIPYLKSIPDGTAIGIEAWDKFKELWGWACTFYLCLGYFSQPTEHFWESIESPDSAILKRQQCVTTTRDGGTLPDKNFMLSVTEFDIIEKNTNIKWIKDLSIAYTRLCKFHEEMDALGAMKCYISIRQELSRSINVKVDLYFILSLVVLSKYCSEAKRQEVSSAWEKLCQTVKRSCLDGCLPNLFYPIKQIVLSGVDIDRNCVLEMRQAREYLAAGELFNARNTALKCWKIINEDEMLEQIKEYWTSLRLPYFGWDQEFVLRVAKLLQHIYSSEERYCAAEWFAKFCLQRSKELRRSFLVAKYGLEYAEFLKERGRQSEAMEQCRLVQRRLEEDFGIEYLEWLPDAPKVVQMLKDMKTSTDTVQNTQY